VDAPQNGIDVPRWLLLATKQEASMAEVSTIGLDLAKNVFQVHGADPSGEVVFRRRLRRNRLLRFFADQQPCLVAMEACGGAHYWAREISKLGHEVRLIPPVYVKPFVKRQKNDAADAEAICEAAQRPTMRFVPIKSEATQAAAVAFRARDLLVRQRTQMINALRGHLSEFGLIVPKGAAHVKRLIAIADDEAHPLPEALRSVLIMMVETIRALNERIEFLDKEIVQRTSEDLDARRLQTIPGVGPVIAAAIMAFAPPSQTFRKGRDFAAWVGLTPIQRSTGGKQKLGKTSKMGERTLRRLLIIGASAVVRWVARKGAGANAWVERMLVRKPRMLVTVALANKMARMIWALLANGGVYRASTVTA
jgi:transposase